MIIYILNIFDLIFTLYVLNNGAIELNPAMQNIPFQIFYKVFVIGILCWWLSKQNSKSAQYGSLFLIIVYAILNLWHITNISVAKFY